MLLASRRDDGEAAGGYAGGWGSKERAVRVWGCWWSAGREGNERRHLDEAEA